MNTTQKLALPNRIFKPGTEPIGLERVNKCSNLKLVKKVKSLLGSDFKKLENSFLSPIIKLGQEEDINFSGKLVHHLLQRRILTTTNQEMWFTFGEQPMRFSLREFFLTTGLPCTREVAKPSSNGNRKKTKYSWMKSGMRLKELVFILKEGKSTMSRDEKIRIGAVILVEGILLAQNASKRILKRRLLRARDFEGYCSYPWGRCAYDTLVDGVSKLTASHLSRTQYELSGFPLAIQLWALSSVHQLGTYFGGKMAVSTTTDGGPLCLKWKHTGTSTLADVARIAQLDKVEVKCIIGDPKLYNNLVEEVVDVEFGKVIGLVEKGYRIKTSDWVKGYIDILVASREIENLISPLESDEYSEKLDKLTKLVTHLQEKVESFEKVVGIKENGEQGKHAQDKEVVEEEDTTIDSFIPVKNQKRTRETREEEEDKEERNKDEGDTNNKEDIATGNVTSNKKQKPARETTEEDIGDNKVDEEGEEEEVEEREGEEETEDEEIEETESEGHKNNTVLPLRQDHQKLGDGKKKAELLTYKRRKRAREDDNKAMDCCQTLIEEEDDNITIAQIIKSRKKCGDVVEDTDGGGDAYSGLEVDYNVSGLPQKLASGEETVATPETEQISEENDENNSEYPSNEASEKEEGDDERLNQ